MEYLTIPDSEQVLLSALEQSIIAVVLINDAGCVLLFNRAAEILWGYERQEMLGRPVVSLLAPVCRPAYLDAIHGNQDASTAGAKTKCEWLLERKDGGQFWGRLPLSKVEVNGRAYCMLMAWDVSLDVEARWQNRLTMLAIDNAERPVMLLDNACRVIRVNYSFSRLYGYALEDIVGKTLDSIMSYSLDNQDSAGKKMSVMWGRSRGQAEVAIRCRDGREAFGRMASSPLIDDENDEFYGYSINVISDITEEQQFRSLERDILGALVSSLSFAELGDYICQQVSEIVPDVIPSIMTVDHRGILRHWSAPQLPDAYNQQVSGMAIGDGVGSCGTAAWRGEPVVAADIEHDASWTMFSQIPLAYGLRACWSYPIRRRDRSVAGTVAFYSRELRQPTLFHERIIDACTHLCSLAIEQEENRQRMVQLVQYDPLTGLPNQYHLQRYLDDILSQQPTREVTLFSVGLDRFKDINEAFGHAAGDRVLVAVTHRLQAFLRAGEWLSRPEGDRFVIVAPDCSAHRASLMTEQLRETINQPVELDGHRLSLSASVGISHYPEGGSNRETLLDNAKVAMYRAKEAGGGYQFFSADMNVAASERLLLGGALKRAINNGELELYYQPQIRLDSGELYGMEALARWYDPVFGNVPTSKFIALAEDIGEIEALSYWALCEACRQLSLWDLAGARVPVVSVNFSPLCFHRDLPETITSILQNFSLTGERLTIEITESAAMALTPDMLAVVHRIRANGIGVSIDDFGTGFSNLSNLVNLPVTEVKIDRSFIDKCESEERLQALVEAVVGIGRSLKLEVVAEGVETEGQSALIGKLGGRIAQGYLFARPMKASDVPGWLQEYQAGKHRLGTVQPPDADA
ncbi:oxygen-sensing cyclic-di-GMP phosphodiesterase DosP [Musicola keenii]|uniref:oxygen-sensing cyclic-di-GMP phosphodiesterase DosP n=1 Tax=Musicola keenii TaxID=2884250 RepID=UPI001782F672|nr:oxygen-sensing cyclic-di-GMP phosphodiesterase DosP [Musicola keenii]